MRRVALLALLAGILAGVPAAGATGVLFIRGGGYGHGIGMSQYGSLGYAQHGKDYRFILGHYYQGTTLGRVDPTQTVRVLLSTGSAAFSGATRAGTKRLNPNLTYRVIAKSDGSLVLLNPAGKKLGRFPAPLRATGPSPLQVAGLGAYRGALEFRPDGGRGVQTVDALGLDDYVRGVIAYEMPSSWPTAALEAQAVAARTYAITTSVSGNGYTLYPDTRSQMYGGVRAETASSNAAVAATVGQVVEYHGTPATTYFFSSSGGYTENIENVWTGAAPEPWLRGVPDPYDSAGGDPYHRWGFDVSAKTAAKKLRGLFKGSFIGVRILRHGVSPRILLAAVVGSRGSTQVTGDQLRQRFGLATTLAAFTTITTSPGARQSVVTHAQPGLLGQFAFQRAIMASNIPALHGTVFPGRAGGRYAVQQLVGQTWTTLMRARFDSGGTFSVRVPSPGTYRIAYAGLDGPAVNVS
jgi:stage II sporulation protein D